MSPFYAVDGSHPEASQCAKMMGIKGPLMAAYGYKQTSGGIKLASALPPKADIG